METEAEKGGPSPPVTKRDGAAVLNGDTRKRVME